MEHAFLSVKQGFFGLLGFSPSRGGESAGDPRALAELHRALIAAAERLNMSDAEADRLESDLGPTAHGAA